MAGRWTNAAITKEVTKTVTLEINKINVNRNGALRIWDTYRWSENELSRRKEFEFVIDGNIKNGYKVKFLYLFQG